MAKGIGSIGEIRKRITTTHEFISTSHHEASHAVYALSHLMRVGQVCVFENKKLKRVHGYTYYDYLSNLDLIQDPILLNTLVKAEIGVSYAGLLAEKMLFKSISGASKVPMFISDGSADDNRVARLLIEKYNLAPPGRKRTLYKRKIMREIQNELLILWDDITLVAHALFQRRKLNFEDLKVLLTEKSKNKKYWKEQFKKIIYFYDDSEFFNEEDLKKIINI